ncbi:hypothetical protein KKG71_03510 [Patescibacteria group bacterium]|nr:hypothetical protein [Patescibacteria group bacterium]
MNIHSPDHSDEQSPELVGNIEIPEIKKLKVRSIERFGIFLEDGGFVHIRKISDFHKGVGKAFEPNELNQWYPVGSSVFVKLEKKEKLINGNERIFYDFMGPADVIDINNEK